MANWPRTVRRWRTVLTTRDMVKALAMAKENGDKVRVETITPKLKRRKLAGAVA
ncbi:hypothetical protein [Mesorhizobium sp. M0276]|uniref:hypothetical protein n=1 Tax=Mesorhizobium sp. M0276 TaxID=2956928 RepID=UPI00333610C6